MKNWFKEKFIEYQLKKREEEAAEKLEFTRLRQFFVVATIHAITDVGYKVHHVYILKENGSGERRVDITCSEEHYKEYSKKHGTYVKYVYTWEKGTPWDFIPKFFDVYTQQKAPYNNVNQ